MLNDISAVRTSTLAPAKTVLLCYQRADEDRLAGRSRAAATARSIPSSGNESAGILTTSP